MDGIQSKPNPAENQNYRNKQTEVEMGYISRKSGNRRGKRALEWTTHKRKVGRPRVQWNDYLRRIDESCR